MARQRIHSSKSVSNKEYCKERKKERKRKKEASEKYVYPKKYQERLENDYIRTQECKKSKKAKKYKDSSVEVVLDCVCTLQCFHFHTWKKVFLVMQSHTPIIL